MDERPGGGLQADLARYCGVARPSVSDWFRGETKTLKAATLILAAEYLGVRPRWLLDGVGPMRDQGAPAAPAPTAPTLGEALEVLGIALAAAPPDMREAAAANLAGLARAGGQGPWTGLVLQLLQAGAAGGAEPVKRQRAA
ncbi:helix-turn-helix domain-containing protein [Pseudaquabacterium rugosum]|uniref:Helix-turn-helix transcriptional regulator n=1 Tax=Pseudaquabacterium rugosum TaxID=2984194 RepID=A0ABU9B7N1_9BURK